MAAASVTKEKKDKHRFHMRLHPEKDADIIEFLEGKHKTDYVKKLIREKIWAEKVGAQFMAPTSPVENFQNENIEPKPQPQVQQKRKQNTFASFQNFTQQTESKENSAVSLF
ncbi:hypothetical protein CON36_36035 [Bacillus cereus]|uniref:Uncharacterized protein n=1 Tax=Bacillus cereus TaxID=1396 RepID=A0A9X6SRV5_BACCE|nr:hypothetical protein [Bacillus cereus]PDZ94020.1 hypothetical protein CON36_36035 [Bacillus cereus]PGP12514.1 hypothetical protein COA01_32365 [Bacillus cereus]